MQDNISNKSMLDMYIYETSQLVEKLEQLIIIGEKDNGFSEEINEIFRIMHTIKGSSAMMLYTNIAELSHAVEDLFYFLRENKPMIVDYFSLSDIILDSIDFIRNELSKIESGTEPDGDSTDRISVINKFLAQLEGAGDNSQSKTIQENSEPEIQRFFITSGKNTDVASIKKFKAVLFFEEGCEMENIRAFAVIHKLSEIAEIVNYIPENIVGCDDSAQEQIRETGFSIYFISKLNMEDIREQLENTVFLRKLELSEDNGSKNFSKIEAVENKPLRSDNSCNVQNEDRKFNSDEKKDINAPQNQGVISVNIAKTDRLMDLLGELVIAESMVTQSPDLKGIALDNFDKAARQLHKIISELQDAVMSIRMIPLEVTFFKMHRIVRDMSRKTGKEVNLEVVGEETEVDKNIINHISDPLMHLIRNAIDHGIETTEERIAKGKSKEGKVTLEAMNAGSDVLVIVKDDGRGLDKKKIYNKAREKGLIVYSENEITDKEIYNLIFLPGFSTNDNITEFSGRGVGMDVVSKNIYEVGGTVSVESAVDSGTTITIRIPLTLAIVDGMNVKVGNSCYTIPTASIKESFRPSLDSVIYDFDNNEMIMVRGQCYPILRIHKYYKVPTNITKLDDGILIMVEHNRKSFCIFTDELLGQQHVVVKPLPSYIKNVKKIEGVGGCTLLGDGSISLILDIEGISRDYSFKG